MKDIEEIFRESENNGEFNKQLEIEYRKCGCSDGAAPHVDFKLEYYKYLTDTFYYITWDPKYLELPKKR